ncbi:MAG: phosphate signaling complex protein PhoU [Gudongella sp.]|nr:phosphate signaling complex protein PhoU [Gudongella sp.]
MRGNFDKELDLLNNEIIKMGGLVEERIESAVKALINRDIALAKDVIQGDIEIDEMERDIESRCLKLILLQQPVAKDLRLISSILKMITDLERIGDHAQDISEITLLFSDEKYIKELIHIPQMAEATIYMVRTSIDAFVNHNADLAYEVINYDDKVDDLFDIIKDELILLIREDINNGEQAINFLMISKYFERIGDHAENIAEWVLFSILGKHVN